MPLLILDKSGAFSVNKFGHTYTTTCIVIPYKLESVKHYNAQFNSFINHLNRLILKLPVKQNLFKQKHLVSVSCYSDFFEKLLFLILFCTYNRCFVLSHTLR